MLVEELAVNSSLPAQGSKFHALAARNDKRNFRLGVSNGVLYILGTYFVSRSIVIPSFFSHLTHSSALIGLVSQFESIGWYLPQFFAATFVVHHARKMPLYRQAVWLRGTAFLGLALITIWNPDPAWLLVFAMLLYGLFSAGAGLSGFVFLELVAKTIPTNRRGRFFGLRASIGSLLSATFGAWLISLFLVHFAFPTNFGFVFLVGAVIATTGLLCMAIMREPRSPTVPEERSMRDHFREGWKIIRTDKRYANYLNARLLMATWTIGVPFLVLFANNHLGFRTGDLGIFIAADCIGVIAGSYFWGRLTDRRSAKACLEVVAIVSAFLPLVVLLYLVFPLPRLLYPIVFSLAAAVDAGTGIGGLTYLIEISPEHDRVTYIGLFNSLMALPCFLTAAAGLLLDLTGYGYLYGIVLAISIWSLFATSKLEHIRKRQPTMSINTP